MAGCWEVKTRARTRDFDHDHLAAFFRGKKIQHGPTREMGNAKVIK